MELRSTSKCNGDVRKKACNSTFIRGFLWSETEHKKFLVKLKSCFWILFSAQKREKAKLSKKKSKEMASPYHLQLILFNKVKDFFFG